MSICLQGDGDMTDRFSERIDLRLFNLASGGFALPTTPSVETRALHSCFTFEQLSDPSFVHDGAIYIAVVLK